MLRRIPIHRIRDSNKRRTITPHRSLHIARENHWKMNARTQVRAVKQNDSASSAASTPLPRGDATLEEMSNMSEDELMKYFMAQSLGMS